VTTSGGAASAGKFTYNGAPTITFLSPTAGPVSGGTNLTILGTAFDGAVSVIIGGQPATSVTVSADKTQITCVTPAGGAVGPNDIQVVASAAGSVTAPAAYTYTTTSNADPPAISSVSPSRGPMAG